MAEDTAPTLKLKRKIEDPGIAVSGEYPRTPQSPSVAPQVSYPPAKQPTILENFKKEREGFNEGGDMRALMIGATPLLAGFLSGNMGGAYEIASGGLLEEDKRVQKHDDKLIDILKSQAVIDAKGKGKGSGSGANPSESVYNRNTGKWHRVPRNIAQIPDLDPAELSRYPEAPKWQDVATMGDIAGAQTEGRLSTQNRYGLLDKPVTGNMGEPLLRNTRTNEVRPAIPASYTAGQAIPWKSQAHQAKAAAEVGKYNARVKPIQDSLAQADVIITSAAQKQPESDSFMVFSIARLAAGPGQLSDQERMAFTGGKSISDWVKVNAEKAKTGKLPDHIRKRIVNLAMKLKATKAARLARIKSQSISKTSKLVDLTPEQFGSLLIDEEAPSRPVTELSDAELDAEIKALKGGK